MEMIIVVQASDESFLTSLVKSAERMEEARAWAAAASERVFEIIINTDDEDKIAEVEEDARLAWDRYDKAIVRYEYDRAQARKKGLIA